MTKCRAASEVVWPYLDRELPPEERYAIARHLEICPHCRAAFEFHRAFLRVLRVSLRDRERLDPLRDRVVAALLAESK